MKKLIVFTTLLFHFCYGYAQITQEMYDKKVEEIGFLKKQITENDSNISTIRGEYQNLLKFYMDTIRSLKTDLSDLVKYKKQKKAYDALLLTKSDSIVSLKSQIIKNDVLILETKKQGEKKAKEENAKGKSEALATIVNSYKNKMFDDLIKTSTKESVEREILLVGNYEEVKDVLNDLQIYFNAEELLAMKFNAAQIYNAQTQLSKIKRQSKLLDTLKDNVEYYQDYSSFLNETINKLILLDKTKSADGDNEIQKLKFNEIVTILSNFMYNYYDYSKYPYLSDIVIEILKRKRPNADADLTDLVKKLE